MPVIHLLYTTDTPRTGQVVGEEHLKLDEFLKNAFCDDATCKYVSETLCSPLLAKEDILYRQEIVRVITANPEFFQALLTVLGKMDVVYTDWQNVKKDYAMLTRTSREPGYTQWTYLKENIRYLLKIKQGIAQFYDLLTVLSETSQKVFSSFLNFLQQSLDLLNQYDALITCLSRASYEHADLSICIEINSMAEIFALMLDVGGRKSSGKILSDGPINLLFYEAIRYTNQVVTLINGGFFEFFHQNASEMLFYRFAVRYIQLLNDAQVRWTFPSIADDAVMQVRSLLDPFLVVQGRTKNIVPRDICMETDQSAILTGDNNTGKTFYLRSLAYILLFTQAGLPIPAEMARVGIRKNFYILFASRECMKQSQPDIGLFEMDAMQLAPIVHKVQGGDFVLLNEIFQSTFYDEAAEALCPILTYLGRKSVQFLLVTHIESLLLHDMGPNVLHLQAGEDFVIRKR